MKDEPKIRRFRSVGWALGAVGLVGVLSYHLTVPAHHPAVIAFSWSLLVYGGLLQHVANLRERVGRLEAQIEALRPAKMEIEA